MHSHGERPEYLREGAIRDLIRSVEAHSSHQEESGGSVTTTRHTKRQSLGDLVHSLSHMQPRTPVERLWAAKALAQSASGNTTNAGVPDPQRRFRSPYDANPYYEASEDPATLALLGTCSDPGCRVGMRSPPIVQDLEARNAALSAWNIRKLGRWQNAGDGVAWGGTAVQAVGDALRFDGGAQQGGAGNLTVLVPDAGVVKFGPASPYPTPLSTGGEGTAEANVHLFNNAWSTNYIFWMPFQGAAEGTLHGSYQWRFSLELR